MPLTGFAGDRLLKAHMCRGSLEQMSLGINLKEKQVDEKCAKMGHFWVSDEQYYSATRRSTL